MQCRRVVSRSVDELSRKMVSTRCPIRSTVKQKVDKINSLLTCLHFRGKSCRFDFYRPHSRDVYTHLSIDWFSPFNSLSAY